MADESNIKKNMEYELATKKCLDESIDTCKNQKGLFSRLWKGLCDTTIGVVGTAFSIVGAAVSTAHVIISFGRDERAIDNLTTRVRGIGNNLATTAVGVATAVTAPAGLFIQGSQKTNTALNDKQGLNAAIDTYKNQDGFFSRLWNGIGNTVFGIRSAAFSTVDTAVSGADVVTTLGDKEIVNDLTTNTKHIGENLSTGAVGAATAITAPAGLFMQQRPQTNATLRANSEEITDLSVSAPQSSRSVSQVSHSASQNGH